MKNPTVFISYSHDSIEHKEWVLKLASDLVKNGVEVTLDQWNLSPGQDIVSFMHNEIALADRVLLICSEQYVTKADKGEGGVGFEKLIVSAELIAKTKTKKYIPLVRANNSGPKTPLYLGARLYLDFNHDADYDVKLNECLKELHGIPQKPKPQLGKNPFSSLDEHAQTNQRQDTLRNEQSIQITKRELECIKLASCGKSSWEIASNLSCSEATVNFHFANIRRKFNIITRAEAVSRALELGLLHSLPATEAMLSSE